MVLSLRENMANNDLIEQILDQFVQNFMLQFKQDMATVLHEQREALHAKPDANQLDQTHVATEIMELEYDLDDAVVDREEDDRATQEFTVVDVDGEELHTSIIASINNDKPALVSCVDDERLEFQESVEDDGELIVHEAEDHEILQATREDLSPLIHPIFIYLIHDKVTSLHYTEFSSPRLFVNTAIGEIGTNEKGFHVADMVFDKSPKPNRYTTCLNLKPPDEDLGKQVYKLVPTATIANFETTKNKKITYALGIPRELDMKHMLSEHSPAKWLYDLYVVLIHKGSVVNNDHYVVHIKDENTHQWWEFDDEQVSGLGRHPIGKCLINSCSKEHQKIYQQWFNFADWDGDGCLTGNDDTQFFSMSNLSRAELKQGWAIADSKLQVFLGFQEFITAVQLLSLAQAGHELGLDLLKTTVDIDTINPPSIEGLDSLLVKKKVSTTNGEFETNGITKLQPSQSINLFTPKFSKKRAQTSLNAFTSITDDLKRLYIEKLKPLEVAYRFNDFAFPLLTNSDFDAKPMVMLLGQYSTGKTTFLKHLLKCNYPGAHIGPELTTDRFVVVMSGTDKRSIPGKTRVVHADMPFSGLTTFGGAVSKQKQKQSTFTIMGAHNLQTLGWDVGPELVVENKIDFAILLAEKVILFWHSAGVNKAIKEYFEVTLLANMARNKWLVAANVPPSPFDYANVANKNIVSGDVSAMVLGGIRMGTSALASRGFVFDPGGTMLLITRSSYIDQQLKMSGFLLCRLVSPARLFNEANYAQMGFTHRLYAKQLSIFKGKNMKQLEQLAVVESRNQFFNSPSGCNIGSWVNFLNFVGSPAGHGDFGLYFKENGGKHFQ